MSPESPLNDTFLNLNISSNSSDTEHYVPYKNRPETYIVPIVFAVIFVVGLLGNGTLMAIFVKHKVMRSIPNTYIISLTAGDLLVIIGTVPFVSTIYTLESWPYGEFVCKLSELLRDVSVGVTALNLVALSVDRYTAIVFPLSKQSSIHTKSLTVLLAVSIWFIAVILAIPGSYFAFILQLDLQGKIISVCYPYPEYMMPWYPRTMVLIKFLLFYTLPLLCTGIFYCLTARHLIRSSQNLVGRNHSHVKQLRARVKVAKIVLIFVVLFAISFLPSHMFLLWFYFYPNTMENYNDFWHVCKIVGYVLTFANSCMNPVALYLVSGIFRGYFQQYLFCCFSNKTLRRKHGHSLTLKTVNTTFIADTPQRRLHVTTDL
ncbi:neuropeptide CCHamide-1 receptor-like [Limulus polyphemus]|uniref:Neuropeptide CCHamide-1 receptor-like n=1 Tax=Limulus polyphemus TaxID=6850 RepID=A0ABM1C4M1_LIMPO|nr:neuropeptide CCHamide-1 receptor-like [Limulus polyphemus]XP_022237327.1 neuropeptide CCHamide-1 receptor-like [Limulus polyphemus]